MISCSTNHSTPKALAPLANAVRSAANIIPETAEMEGTLRVFDPDIRKRFIQRIQEITQNIAAAYRTKAEIEVLSDVPPMVCDKKEVDWCSDIIREVDDSLSVDQFHAMGSEDFACYSELVPTAFFMMGAGVDDPKAVSYTHLRAHET